MPGSQAGWEPGICVLVSFVVSFVSADPSLGARAPPFWRPDRLFKDEEAVYLDLAAGDDIAARLTQRIFDEVRPIAEVPGSSRPVTPLAIIALFVAVVEIAMVTAATRAVGPIQWLFAIFSVLLGCAIPVTFFTLLWRRNQVLFSPKDFADGTALDFVRAMHLDAQSATTHFQVLDRVQLLEVRLKELEVEQRELLNEKLRREERQAGLDRQMEIRRREIELVSIEREPYDRREERRESVQIDLLRTLAERGKLDGVEIDLRGLAERLINPLDGSDGPGERFQEQLRELERLRELKAISESEALGLPGDAKEEAGEYSETAD